MLALIASMPAFASAGVVQGHLPNEVIPTKMMSDGTSCPQLDFGHKVVNKAMSVLTGEDFMADINSVTWSVSVVNMAVFGSRPQKGSEHVSLLGASRAKLGASPTKGECSYSLQHDRDGKRIDFKMSVKPSNEAVKAAHIKSVTAVIEKIKAAGVVSRVDLLEIINKVMP